MRPSASLRLRALTCAALTAAALCATPGAPATAAPGEAASQGLAARVEQLNREIARVGDELARAAVEYERAADDLARRTQAQFAARSDAEARTEQAQQSRSALDGLARAAYKGGLPPMVTALLSGDPRTVGDLAYVQRSVNAVGADRRAAARAAYLSQSGAGTALVRSDVDRRAALAQRQALDVQLREIAKRADRLTAELDAAAAELARARAEERARALASSRAAALREIERRGAAMRSAALAAAAAAGQAAAAAGQAAAAAGFPSTGTGAGCLPPSDSGEANGFLSDAGLCPLEVGGGHRLRTDAAAAFNVMNRAHVASTGVPLCVTDSYRSFAEQVDVFKRKPALAATPGRSQHGWGLALDLGCGVQTFGTPAHEWMRANGPSFGWIHPAWAQQGGSKPEAWHWEFVGGR